MSHSGHMEILADLLKDASDHITNNRLSDY